MEELQGFLKVSLLDVAPSLDVECVSLALLELLDVHQVLKSLVDVPLDERAPCLMLVDLEVALVSDESRLVLAESLVVVSLPLIKKTNLDESVCLPLECKGVGQNRVLEVADCLLDLVCLCEDHTQLIQDLTLLIEVGAHLQHGDQGTDGMVVGLKLLVQDADSIPELGVFDVLQTVEGSLVGVEGLLEVLDEQVAVAKSCPGGSVLGVDGDELDVVLNCCLVLSVRGAVLSELVDSVDVDNVLALPLRKVGVEVHVRSSTIEVVGVRTSLQELIASLIFVLLRLIRDCLLVLEASSTVLIVVLLLKLSHVELGFTLLAHLAARCSELPEAHVVLLLLLVAELDELLEEKLRLETLSVGVSTRCHLLL